MKILLAALLLLVPLSTYAVGSGGPAYMVMRNNTIYRPSKTDANGLEAQHTFCTSITTSPPKNEGVCYQSKEKPKTQVKKK